MRSLLFIASNFWLLIIFLITSCGSGGDSVGMHQSLIVKAYRDGNVTLTWDAPVANTDGSELTDLAGFKIYYGNTSRDYYYTEDVGIPTIYVVRGLEAGLYWCFAVTAYNVPGRESVYSDEVCINI